jgi:succinoglycan biosynthesis protein ExoA
MSDVCSARPAVTAVVPCRNERDGIEGCVRSLLEQQEPPGGFEIIVVDGMSDDGTRDVLERLARDRPCLRVVDNPARITPAAMNAGIRAARGEFISIMGAHNRYAPDYLWQSVQVLRTTGADNVGGAMICEGNARIQKAIAAAHHSPFSVGGARWHNADYEGEAGTVFGGVYRREVFDRIGMFDEDLVRNQDDELNLRLVRSGGRIWQCPRIRSWYEPRKSFRSLFRQYLQYGYWRVRVIQKHRLPASLRQVVPAGFVAGLIALGLAAPWSALAARCLAGVLAAYGVATLAASVLAAGQHGWGLLLPLPLVFTCFHFGYGLGFLRGVWDFGVRRRRADRVFTKLTRG